MKCDRLRDTTLAFIADRRADGSGRYRYAAGCAVPTLYASTYAAMARHLLGDLQGLPAAEREAWVAYLQAHQDDDGLFRDPVIFNQSWFKDDPLWCGRPHLTCHVIAALACLDAVAAKPLRWLEPWRDVDALVRWLEARDWVLTNQMPDGGFVFIRDVPFEYGHNELRSARNVGAMFPTWFRLLSLALIGQALPGHAPARVPWRFVRCPGMQFWGECGKIAGIERIELVE